MKIDLKAIWSSWEKPTIYILVGAFIVLKALSPFVPWIGTNFTADWQAVALGTIFVMMFRVIDSKLNAKTPIVYIKRFSGDLSTIIDTNKKYSTIRIFALNGDYYRSFINQSGIRVSEVQWLLRKPTETAFLNPESNLVKYQEMCRGCLHDIEQMGNRENIGKSTARHYDFDSFMHFMVIDDVLVHYGMLKPKKEFPGSDVLPSRVEHDTFSEGRTAISQFREMFDCIYNNFSSPAS